MARAKFGGRGGGSIPILAQVGRWTAAAAAFVYVYVTAVFLTLPDVRPLATDAPETTAFIELRRREANKTLKTAVRRWDWVDYDDISSQLKRAVLTEGWMRVYQPKNP